MNNTVGTDKIHKSKIYKSKVKPIANLVLEGTDIAVMEEYIQKLKDYTNSVKVRYSGPVSFKTKILKINTRRASSGEGSGTQFYYTKRIWKKRIQIYNEKIMSYVLKTMANTQNLLIEIELV